MAVEATAAGSVARMVERYPGWENQRTILAFGENGDQAEGHLAEVWPLRLWLPPDGVFGRHPCAAH